MTKTAYISFPITLFLYWWLYVVSRAGQGPGFTWSRVPQHAEWTAAMAGVAYLIFVAIALAIFYFTNLRGKSVGVSAPLLAVFTRFAATFIAAVVAGIVLAELFCFMEERAFDREAARHFARAVPDSVTHERPPYSRKRWWPGDAQILYTADPSVPK